MLIDVLKDTLIDTAKLVPYLLITYMIMEYIESHSGSRLEAMLRREGKEGPVFGALAGIVPQCGLSAAAASLYAGGVISLGTLLAVFLSTSDEMLPILLSEHVAGRTIAGILAFKALYAMLAGTLVAFLSHRHAGGRPKQINDLCQLEKCGCQEEEGIIRAALHHTVNITAFIFVITLAAAIGMRWIGEANMAAFLGRNQIAGILIAALIGLIPNCAASVMITELYLKGILSAGQMMSGLLTAAGTGVLVLFRTNRSHQNENVRAALLLFLLGAAGGLAVEFLGIYF